MELLVAQLKNQDPLNPSDPQKFAVDLATFSQLGELVKLNKTVAAANDPANALASYLGTEVTLDGNTVKVANNDGGFLKVDLAQNASDLRVELLRADGSVAESRSVGAVEAGKHTIALNDLNTSSGDYSVRVVATSAQNGQEFSPTMQVAGIVTGFRPGPDPVLLLGSREVSTADILEVNIPAMVG